MEQFFEANRFHFSLIEQEGAAAISEVLSQTEWSTPMAQDLGAKQLAQYARDAQYLPLDVVQAHMDAPTPDPAVLAADADVPLAVALRRLAVAPTPERQDPIGMIIADGTGLLLMRKTTDGFLVPRSGRACPLWPLYEALASPGRPVQRVLQHNSAWAHVCGLMRLLNLCGRWEPMGRVC